MQKNLVSVMMAFVLGVVIIALVETADGKDVRATGYYTIYESEIDGIQKVSKLISGKTYTLKASFLFGGFGIAMQGTGRIGLGGDYIH